MTAPRIVRPGDYLLITARTVVGTFLLKPAPEISRAIEFLVAHYANQFNMELAAVCVMSNHFHWVVKDLEGNSSAFMQMLHRQIALLIKREYNWSGSVLEKGTNSVRLLDEEAVFNKIAYVIANPVEAGAVRDPRSWPGLVTSLDDFGEERELTRPEVLNGLFPDKATLRMTLPGEASTAKEKLRRILTRRTASAVARRKKFVGRAKCLTTHHTFRPPKDSPWARGMPVFRRPPRFAATGKQARQRALLERKVFLKVYYAALKAWKAGRRGVSFPPGTAKMLWLHKVRVQSSDAWSKQLAREHATTR